MTLLGCLGAIQGEYSSVQRYTRSWHESGYSATCTKSHIHMCRPLLDKIRGTVAEWLDHSLLVLMVPGSKYSLC